MYAVVRGIRPKEQEKWLSNNAMMFIVFSVPESKILQIIDIQVNV